MRTQVPTNKDGWADEVRANDLVELRPNSNYPLLINPEQRIAAESFAVLRTRLLSARTKSEIHSVVVASPQKQDGKSLTSANLAISLAQLCNERILLVDGDLRISGLSKMWDLRERSGVADFLQKSARFEECVQSTSLSHLYVAPAGFATDEVLPAILEGTRWPEFVRTAEAEFGFIIVDSVPVSAPIADFELLLAPCDGLLLVVNIHKTRRDALDATIQQTNGKLLGVVMNNSEPRSGYAYGSYYGTGNK